MYEAQLNIKKLKKIAIILFVILALIVIGLITLNYYRSQYTVVTLDFSVGSGSPSVRFNNKLTSPETKDTYTYKLYKGYYKLSISDVGYKDFSTSLKLVPKQNIYVNINLIPSVKPSATDLSKISTVITGTSTSLTSQWPNATATAQYFDNDTWAYVTIHTNMGLGLAYLIVNYDSSSARWIIVRGPIDDSADVGSLQGLPADLQNYLENIGYQDGG